jgi:AraC family transcriptional regulator
MPAIQSDPVAKALWFIENRSSDELRLGEIAAACGVSPFYLTRAFGEATGRSVMRYVRARRLSEAARALCDGNGGILDVALSAGYGSHEAFTRAFREQFGMTPERVRGARRLDGLQLVDALTRELSVTNTAAQLPRIENSPLLLIAGLGERFAYESLGAIPALWQRFVPHLGHVPGQVGSVTYGVCQNGDEHGLDYVAGMEVTSFDGLPAEFTRVRLPERRYAVFEHHGHVSAIRATWDAALTTWFPQAGLTPADAPSFERYDDRFDPRSGNGIVEIWLPIA